MTKERYSVTLGLNYEFKEIIDHNKRDKHITVFDFLKQVNEQDKAFKKLKKENEQLKNEVENIKDVNVRCCNDYSAMRRDVLKYKEENEQLKQQLDEIKAYDDEHFAEAKHINDIYKEKGFYGVIEYAKDKLQNYGVVKEVEEGLWVMVTGGWSDNEFWLDCLNNPISIFCMKHYRGYLRGGAFYYTEKPRGDVEIKLKGDFE